MYICKCGKSFENKQAFCGHSGKCKIAHPNKQFNYNSNSAWNKGLTKYTDDRVMKISNSLIGKSVGHCLDYEKELNRRRKISATMKSNSNCGGYREGSGRGKHGYFRGFKCDSTYELVYIIYNLDHNIQFKRCDRVYTYTFNDKIHKYHPDFELDDGSLVEIKGYINDIVQVKLNSVTDRPIKLLTGLDLKYAFDWVKTNYTYNNLTDLYDN